MGLLYRQQPQGPRDIHRMAIRWSFDVLKEWPDAEYEALAERFDDPAQGGPRRRSRIFSPFVQSDQSIPSSNPIIPFHHGHINKENPDFVVARFE